MIFETVAIINGAPCHLDYHQQRLDRSRQMLGLAQKKLLLSEVIEVPEEYRSGLVRCRIDCAEEVLAVKFAAFKPSLVRHLILVEADISYEHKWIDRTAFEKLRAEHSEFDDVILMRNGLLTDSTMANLAFCADNTWYTPDVPLLPGTTRARLIDSGRLQTRSISREQLGEFQQVVLINALRGFNTEAAIDVSTLRFAP